MITLRKLIIYEKYGGDEGGLARAGSPDEQAAFLDDSWCEIDFALTEMRQVRDGLLAPTYIRRLDRKLSEIVDGPEVLTRLKGLV